MNRRLMNALGLKSGEGTRAALMFFFGLLIIAALTILKPVGKSLFLTRFGVSQLPIAFLLVAVFSAGAAAAFARVSIHRRMIRIIRLTLAGASLSLGGFWLLLRTHPHGGGLIYGLYVFTSIFGVVAGTQFWLLANEIFDARQAKRLFSLIGSGAITGGILGGYLVNFLAPRLRTENLLFFCIGFLLIGGFLAGRVRASDERDFSPGGRVLETRKRVRKSGTASLRAIFSSRHVAYLTGILALGVVVADLADYQFSALASRYIAEADLLTAFFGFWLSTVNLISLAVQLFVTGWVLRNFGVTTSLFILPLALLLGSGALLVAPALWSAVLIRISDGSFKHSLNKAALELLALPIPPGIKSRAKAVIDVFIKNSAKGAGGLLLIVLTTGLGFRVAQISLVSTGLIAVWLVLILRVRRPYIDAFRMAIEKRSIDPDAAALHLEDAAVFQDFLDALDSPGEPQVLYVLRLLEGIDNPRLIPYLSRLIDHPSPDIRAQALRMSSLFPELDLSEKALAMVNADDLRLQTEGVCYLYQASPDPSDSLAGFIRSRDDRVRAAAMLCAASEWRTRRDFREAIDMDVLIDGMLERSRQDRLEEETSRFLKLQTAIALGRMRDPGHHRHLEILLNDSCPAVVEAAAESAGFSTAPQLVPTLIRHLEIPRLRKCARDALVEYGEEAVEPLAAELRAPAKSRLTRTAALHILSRIGSRKSLSVLLENLRSSGPDLRGAVIQSLRRFRKNFPALRINPAVIRREALVESRLFQEYLSTWNRQAPGPAAPGAKREDPAADAILSARRLLAEVLSERLDAGLNRMIILLGLNHPLTDMRNVFQGLTSREPRLRADSIELLDNLLEPGLKRIILPVLENGLPGIREKRLSPHRREGISAEEPTLRAILKGEDGWLRAVTIHFLTVRGEGIFRNDIQPLADSPDPLVREAALHYLNNPPPDMNR